MKFLGKAGILNGSGPSSRETGGDSCVQRMHGYLELLVILLVREPSPSALNVISVDGLIDVAW